MSVKEGDSGSRNLPSEMPSCGLTPEQRRMIERHFAAISEIMRQHNMVKMSGGWRIEGNTEDGRTVVHKFTVNGYVKTYPPGYETRLGDLQQWSPDHE